MFPLLSKTLKPPPSSDSAAIPASASTFNLNRKLFHLFGLILPLILELDMFSFLDSYIQDATRNVALYTIVSILIILFSFESLRFCYPRVNMMYTRIFGGIMKECEEQRYTSSLSYLIAYSFLLLFCPVEIITLSCIFLCFSDPLAAWVGCSRLGNRWQLPNSRSLAGFIAFVSSSWVLAVVYCALYSLGVDSNSPFALFEASAIGVYSLKYELLLYLLLATIFTGIVELFSPNCLYGLVDDNLTIPLGGAMALALCLSWSGPYPLSLFFRPF